MNEISSIGGYSLHRKKYTTKYLPVEGQPKIGDMVKLVNDPADAHIADNDCLLIGCDKVKLFLISTDIQVGDIMIDKAGKEHTSTDISHEHCLRAGCFKVIGEISPDALSYVKERMELKEDQIKRDVLIKDTFDSEYEHLHPKGNEKIRNLGETEKLIKELPIKILGLCGHFH